MATKAFLAAVEKFKQGHKHGQIQDRRDRASSMGRPHIFKCDRCGAETPTMLDTEDTA